MTYRWDWEVFLRDTGGDQTYLDWMLSAWGWTLAVSGASFAVALAAGAVVGTLRTAPGRGWRYFANTWVEVFRGIPLLVQIFVWYHVIPAVFPVLKGLSTYVLVVLALGLFTSARIAEQVRAGIEALPRGQRMASLALGLTLPQTYRYVVLPMAFRIVLPPLTSEAMNILKNSSVAFAVGISELTLFALQAQEETARGIEIYLAVTTLYVASALTVNRLMVRIEKRVRVPGYIGELK